MFVILLTSPDIAVCAQVAPRGLAEGGQDGLVYLSTTAVVGHNRLLILGRRSASAAQGSKLK